MRVQNTKTGKWFFCEVESPEEAVIVAYEQNDNHKYGLIRYPGYARHLGLRHEGHIVRCGDWIADRIVNRWNKLIYQGCNVRVKHGPCRGFSGRVSKFCDSRTPYVEMVGFVLAEYLQVIKK